MGKTLILYASTTGNTKAAAQTIYNVLSKNGKDVVIYDVIQAANLNLREFDNLIIGSSTWDEGMINYQMSDFLVKYFSEPANTNLSAKKFVVFGCGESTYEHFGEAVPKLEEMFHRYGAEMVLEGLKIDFDPQTEENLKQIEAWAEKLSAKL